MEHEHSLVIPPNFGGNNYAYWKEKFIDGLPPIFAHKVKQE